MRYKILKDGEVINTIVSDEEFCSAYCEENGYTYELEPEPNPEPNIDSPSDTELKSRIIDLETQVADLTTAIERGLSL